MEDVKKINPEGIEILKDVLYESGLLKEGQEIDENSLQQVVLDNNSRNVLYDKLRSAIPKYKDFANDRFDKQIFAVEQPQPTEKVGHSTDIPLPQPSFSTGDITGSYAEDGKDYMIYDQNQDNETPVQLAPQINSELAKQEVDKQNLIDYKNQSPNPYSPATSGFLTDPIVNSIQGIGEGLDKAKEGLELFNPNVMALDENGEVMNPLEKATKGAVKTVKGIADAGINTAMTVTPMGVALNYAFAGANEIPIVSNVVNFAMSPATSIANKINGKDIDPESTLGELLGLADLTVAGLVFHKGGQSIKGIKELAKKDNISMSEATKKYTQESATKVKNKLHDLLFQKGLESGVSDVEHLDNTVTNYTEGKPLDEKQKETVTTILDNTISDLESEKTEENAQQVDELVNGLSKSKEQLLLPENNGLDANGNPIQPIQTEPIEQKLDVPQIVTPQIPDVNINEIDNLVNSELSKNETPSATEETAVNPQTETPNSEGISVQENANTESVPNAELNNNQEVIPNNEVTNIEPKTEEITTLTDNQPKGEEVGNEIEQGGHQLEGKPTSAENELIPSVQTVKTTDLTLDPDRFQFKSGKTKGGATGSISSEVPYSKNLAGVISVWKDPKDGKTYVVNGHNRFNKALESGVENMDVQYLDVETPSEARMVGALQNIAEGKGTTMDAVNLFLSTGADNAQILKDMGVNITSGLAEKGFNISNLIKPLFNKYIKTEIGEGIASQLGKLPKDLQVSAYEKLVKGKPNISEKLVAEGVSMILANKGEVGTTTLGGLFGGEELNADGITDRLALQVEFKEELTKDKNLFTKVKSNEKSINSKVGKVDKKKATEIVFESKKYLDLFDKLKTTKPIQDIFRGAIDEINKLRENNGTKNTRGTKQVTEIKNRAFTEIKNQLDKELKGGLYESDKGMAENEVSRTEEPTRNVEEQPNQEVTAKDKVNQILAETKEKLSKIKNPLKGVNDGKLNSGIDPSSFIKTSYELSKATYEVLKTLSETAFQLGKLGINEFSQYVKDMVGDEDYMNLKPYFKMAYRKLYDSLPITSDVKKLMDKPKEQRQYSSYTPEEKAELKKQGIKEFGTDKDVIMHVINEKKVKDLSVNERKTVVGKGIDSLKDTVKTNLSDLAKQKALDFEQNTKDLLDVTEVLKEIKDINGTTVNSLIKKIRDAKTERQLDDIRNQVANLYENHLYDVEIENFNKSAKKVLNLSKSKTLDLPRTQKTMLSDLGKIDANYLNQKDRLQLTDFLNSVERKVNNKQPIFDSNLMELLPKNLKEKTTSAYISDLQKKVDMEKGKQYFDRMQNSVANVGWVNDIPYYDANGNLVSNSLANRGEGYLEMKAKERAWNTSLNIYDKFTPEITTEGITLRDKFGNEVVVENKMSKPKIDTATGNYDTETKYQAYRVLADKLLNEPSKFVDLEISKGKPLSIKDLPDYDFIKNQIENNKKEIADNLDKFPEGSKQQIQKLLDTDFDALDVSTANDYIRILDNLKENNSIDNLGEVQYGSGRDLINELKKGGYITKNHKLSGTAKLMGSLSQNLRDVSGSLKNASILDSKLGINDLMNGNKESVKELDVLAKDFNSVLEKDKKEFGKRGEDIYSIENNVKRGLIAELVAIDTRFSKNENLKMAKQRINHTLNELIKSNEYLDKYQTEFNELTDMKEKLKGIDSYDKMLDTLLNDDTLRDNLQVVLETSDLYKKHKIKERMDVVSQMYENKKPADVLNYTHRNTINLGRAMDSDFGIESIINKKIDKKLGSSTNERAKTLSNGQIMDLDFNKNQLKNFKELTYDLHTKPAITKMAGFFSLPYIEQAKVFGNIENAKFIKNALENTIKKQRGESEVMDYANDTIAKDLVNSMGNMIQSSSLASPAQLLNQTIPVIARMATVSPIHSAQALRSIVKKVIDKDYRNDVNKFIRDNINIEMSDNLREGIEKNSSKNLTKQKLEESIGKRISSKIEKFTEWKANLVLKGLSMGDMFSREFISEVALRDYLKKKGYDFVPENLDNVPQEILDEASSFGRLHVDTKQVPSDISASSSLSDYGNKNTFTRFLKNLVMPFSTFSTNAFRELGRNTVAMFDKNLTKEERTEAGKEFAGIVTEQIAFKTLKALQYVGTAWGAKKVWNMFSDEDFVDDKSFWDKWKKNMTEMIVDLPIGWAGESNQTMKVGIDNLVQEQKLFPKEKDGKTIYERPFGTPKNANVNGSGYIDILSKNIGSIDRSAGYVLDKPKIYLGTKNGEQIEEETDLPTPIKNLNALMLIGSIASNFGLEGIKPMYRALEKQRQGYYDYELGGREIPITIKKKAERYKEQESSLPKRPTRPERPSRP